MIIIRQTLLKKNVRKESRRSAVQVSDVDTEGNCVRIYFIFILKRRQKDTVVIVFKVPCAPEALFEEVHQRVSVEIQILNEDLNLLLSKNTIWKICSANRMLFFLTSPYLS